MSTTNDGDDFATLLRRHRMSAGLSQEELAEKAGLSADAIASLERGRRRAPRPLTVRMLAAALNLSDVHWLELVESLRRSSGGYHPRVQGPPWQSDSLIGRDAELAEASALLARGRTRLLTLTGVGGVGKTRLAIALAEEVKDTFAAGVCWVNLADRPDGPEVVDAVSTALGLRPASDTGEVDVLADHIGGRELLLVLDNCEHVVATCARLCAVLLERCARLKILVTTRELMRTPGEVVRHLEPLAVPPVRAEADEIQKADAVRMFLARAAAHGVQPTDERLVHVSRLCRQVEGIPLAIELAAARVNVLTIEQIADELVTSSRILSGGNRTAHRRQQTIDAALDWSYDLLDPDEREFFEAVAIFAGGWTFAAAQAVCCTARSDRCPERILDLTGKLIDKSLIVVDREGPEARYSMFTVIRQYADHRLDDSGKRSEVEHRHLQYFVQLAEQAEMLLEGGDQAGALERLDTELDNLRVALGRAVGHERGHDAVRLAGALWRYFYLRGNYAEGRDWLDAALRIEDPDEADHMLARAKALRGLGYLAFLQCDYHDATTSLEAALTLYRQAGDDIGAALALRHLGGIARERADYERAVDLHAQSLTIYTERGDRNGIAWARHHLGFVCWLREDFTAAHEHATAALAHFQRTGDGEGLTWAKIDLGAVAMYAGDLATAERLLHRSLARAQRLGYREGIAWALNQLGVVAMLQNRYERAIHLLDESLAEHQELGDRWRTSSVLEALAAVAQRRGNTAYAAFLLGAASAVRDTLGVPIPLCERPSTDLTVKAVQAALAPQDFEEAWAAGQATPLHAVAGGYPPDSLSTPDTQR